ncbi:hypothetical protein, partial [Acetobacter lambici]|uniref:hypothetical protein n=1 Tax=Acetobacter lambici TaxID=1332824 RepID=UPI0020A54368
MKTNIKSAEMAHLSELAQSRQAEEIVLEPFWKFAMIGFQEVLSVIQRQDVDASTTRPHGR